MINKLSMPRVQAFDLLRGYLLLVILVDHLYKFPGFFDVFTGRGRLWVSAAEGFFLISGVMVGLVRGGEMGLGRARQVYQKILQRALAIYIWSVSLTLFYTFLGNGIKQYVPVKPEIIGDASFWQVVWSTITLRYSYGWADFLNYYAVFLLGAILVLFLLNKGKALVVLFLSIGLWFLRGNNFYFAWQILFVVGIVIGYLFRELEKKFIALSSIFRFILCAVFSFVTIGTLIVSVGIVYFSGFATALPLLNIVGENADVLFDKMTLAPGRLILAMVWFTTFFVFIRRYENFFVTHLAWLLLPIGRNSLSIYVFQSVLIYALYPILSAPSGFFVNFLINFFSIVLVWLMALYFTRHRFTFLKMVV